MMIGAALSKIGQLRFDWSFFYAVCGIRYVIWPTLGLSWVAIDVFYLKILPEQIHTFIILICSCPLAANTVAYATKLNLYPILTSCMVLITTIFALLFIPLLIGIQHLLF